MQNLIPNSSSSTNIYLGRPTIFLEQFKLHKYDLMIIQVSNKVIDSLNRIYLINTMFY